ncbi:DUF433 domain-containing protein [Nocardioides sp.]|uniref:DUF433 domain-containing protein n=1 Tax=Nocardioides sp. TaxID=35761 RepID=UPI00271BBFC4|nr:DUF433 domain-containing protein [Nocardioides sp.]MDO9458472.1 hypothetical protein [Nocardioides sp.]
MDANHTPLLTAREAARHLRMPESTLDSWIVSRRGEPSLIHAVTPEQRGWPRLPFVAIIEAYVLRPLRELGAPMDEVRKAAAIVREEFGDEYALATQRIATDGVDLFVRLADDSMLQVKHQQLGIREVLDGYLHYVTWDDEGRPAQLRLSQYPDAAAVIIDPRFGWGSPVLASSKVPVDAVLQLWRNGDPMADVAAEYGLITDVVEGVLRAASAA